MRPTLLPLLTALTACSAIAQASPATDARRMVQAAYASMDAAIGRRDVAGATAFFAPGYVSIDSHGRRISAGQEQKSAAGLFAATAGPLKAKTTIQTFTITGPNEADATVHVHMTAMLVNPQTRQTAPATFDITSRDLWVKAGRGWRQKQSRALSTAMTLNGKAVPQN